MNRWSFWKKDWFVGLLVALVFLLGANSDLMQSLERKDYDLGVLASSRVPSDKIAVIAIDEQSIANLERWPWPRAIHAKMVDILAAGHAKLIGHTAFFFEPQVDAGLGYIYKIAGLLGKSALFENAAAESSVSAASQVELPQFDALLLEAKQNLAARSLNLEPMDTHVNLSEGVQLGNQKIATDPALQMHTFFYKDRDGWSAFPVDSFYDVFTGKIPAEKYHDKIVLIGAMAAGVGTLQVTPISSDMSPALILMHSVFSILKGDYFVAPGWEVVAQAPVQQSRICIQVHGGIQPEIS